MEKDPMPYVSFLEEKLSPRDAAKLLGVSLSVVLRLIREGEFVTVHVTKKKQFMRKSDVEEYMKKLNDYKNLPPPVSHAVKMHLERERCRKLGEKLIKRHYQPKKKATKRTAKRAVKPRGGSK